MAGNIQSKNEQSGCWAPATRTARVAQRLAPPRTIAGRVEGTIGRTNGRGPRLPSMSARLPGLGLQRRVGPPSAAELCLAVLRTEGEREEGWDQDEPWSQLRRRERVDGRSQRSRRSPLRLEEHARRAEDDQHRAGLQEIG